MGIVKILVDDTEREYITSLDDDEVEFNNDINVFEDTIDLGDLVSDIKKINEDSELDG